MKKGEIIILYEQGTNVMVTQKRNKKDVSMMSTCANDGTVIVKRAGKNHSGKHVLFANNAIKDSVKCLALKTTTL